jgi:two-component system sensor histidine kinase DegS
MEFNQTTEGNNLRQEVENLRDIAKEAYNQMRDVLTMLSPETCTNLNHILSNYADKISERASFKLNFKSQGEPRTLPPSTQRNVFYLFQETLANIEKHAHAQQVDVDVKWEKDNLEMIVEDNGTGYDPAALIPEGHFGLKNMRERALESNGQLLISSQPGHGTRLVLCIPIPTENKT